MNLNVTADSPTQLQALELVLQERLNQDAKWGKDQTQYPEIWQLIIGEEYGEVCQALLTYRFGKAENLSKNRQHALEELVQVTASGLAALEDLLQREDW